MTRHGHILFGLVVTGVTAAAIWVSVAIPQHSQRQSRAQISALLATAESSTSHGACPLDSDVQLQSPDLAAVSVHRTQCAITLQLSGQPPLAASVREAKITLVWNSVESADSAGNGQHRGWSCVATGGHGASQADFPPECQYRTQQPLL